MGHRLVGRLMGLRHISFLSPYPVCNVASKHLLSQSFHCRPSSYVRKIRSSSEIDDDKPNISKIQTKMRCLRCNNLYIDNDNSSAACSFHGHTTGEKGLFSLAPPHQGIDGEWSDRSGVIVYKWNEKDSRDGVVVKSMVKMLLLVVKDGMCGMMMASLCTDLLNKQHKKQ